MGPRISRSFFEHQIFLHWSEANAAEGATFTFAIADIP